MTMTVFNFPQNRDRTGLQARYRPRSRLGRKPVTGLMFTLLAVLTGSCSPKQQPAQAPQAATPPAVAAGGPRNAKIPFFEKQTKSPRPPRDDDWFEDITQAAGIDFAYRDGQEAGFYQLVENLGGCVGMLDFDKDGDIDKNDLSLISKARNQPASGPDDPRDSDADGRITPNDVKMCIPKCTRANCATQ